MKQYTYKSAATELHPTKQGVNRIEWEDNGSNNSSNWTKLNKQYFPTDPRTVSNALIVQLQNSSPSEIEVIKNILGI